jgi:hypothetical protein
LLCGDSTSLKDVLRVMNKDKAALVATDPPYLVDYTGERPNDSGKDWTDRYREIDIQDADGFFRAVFVNVLEVLGPKGAIYWAGRYPALRQKKFSSPPSRRRSRSHPGPQPAARSGSGAACQHRALSFCTFEPPVQGARPSGS